ncbi:hypothetical protein RND71_039548 [Anisodus tanguticus]|uniref:Uncharacterized protein n=1 Tax=Anisodus tanguticus TaxID=243964 RepID=A0AAE1US37_9SOLA|nr:hypothetical protein RND71_039548 [Anisodus tanguticus]
MALLVVGASADVALGVGAESPKGEGGDETSSSSGDSAELEESDVGDDDGELAIGDDDFGDWAGAVPLVCFSFSYKEQKGNLEAANRGFQRNENLNVIVVSPATEEKCAMFNIATASKLLTTILNEK